MPRLLSSAPRHGPPTRGPGGAPTPRRVSRLRWRGDQGRHDRDAAGDGRSRGGVAARTAAGRGALLRSALSPVRAATRAAARDVAADRRRPPDATAASWTRLRGGAGVEEGSFVFLLLLFHLQFIFADATGGRGRTLALCHGSAEGRERGRGVLFFFYFICNSFLLKVDYFTHNSFLQFRSISIR